MKDLIKELELTERALSTRDVDGREARDITLSRTYDATVEEVWSACTEADRLERWLGKVSGDFQLGGTYQIEGNAGGDIIACEPPERVRVTWIFGDPGPDPYSEVDVRLAPADNGGTTLTLTHSAVYEPEFWEQYGPGSGGVGWDLALLALSALLSGEPLGDAEEFEQSPEARELVFRSADGWGAAHAAAGGTDDEVSSAVTATKNFYAPPLDADTSSA